MGGRHNVATRFLLPVLSSPVSVGINDIMDTSPLSHKGLPSPEITSSKPDNPPEDYDDDDEMMLQTSVDSLWTSSNSYNTRERLVLRSFSSTCTKRHSANALADNLDLDAQPTVFRFSSAANLPLAECFQKSPLQKRPFFANSPSLSVPRYRRRRSLHAGLAGTGESYNSSLFLHTKWPWKSFQLPRRQYHRSLSLFENPAKVVPPRRNSPGPQRTVQSIMNSEDVQDPMLPHFYPEGENETIPRISQETFLDVLQGRFEDQYTQRMVIDCRFEYEYEGGHIDGAINYHDKELLMGHLFETPMDGKVLLILHCEYSAHRAPMMARFIRSKDRAINAEYYPRLSYPEIYILDGGYSEFFTQHRHRCCPQSYVKMNDKKHVGTCEREMGKLQRNRKGPGRAQTFTFGLHESLCQASPTVPGRNSSRDGKSFKPGVGRSFTRRAASY